MTAAKTASKRLAWLEGIRIFAAVMILLYHAQLLISHYAYTPQPIGLTNNLRLITLANNHLGHHWVLSLLRFPIWFGFQFVDVFVLISGFALVFSLKQQSFELGSFFKRRFLRILAPFWTVAVLSYPILWAIAVATDSYSPDAWQVFAGITFPLLFQFDGSVLLATSGPWWFIPLILSFTLVFPFLWFLLRRWGVRNFLLVSVVLTVGYRALAVYAFGGHPTYVTTNTPHDWVPFLPFIAKLSTFALGMVAAQAYRQGKGPLFWQPRYALIAGGGLYGLGFISQFSRFGWIFADLLLPVGLTLVCMVFFRWLTEVNQLESLMLWLGSHSYSYFLIHNFVVDRTINLVVDHRLPLYHLLLPVMVVGTLILAALSDYTTPLLRRILAAAIRDVDYLLSIVPPSRLRRLNLQIGDRVRFRGERGWIVLKVERLLDDREVHLCQISDGMKTIWSSEDDLELENIPPEESNGHSKVNSTYS